MAYSGLPKLYFGAAYSGFLYLPFHGHLPDGRSTLTVDSGVVSITHPQTTCMIKYEHWTVGGSSLGGYACPGRRRFSAILNYN